MNEPLPLPAQAIAQVLPLMIATIKETGDTIEKLLSSNNLDEMQVAELDRLHARIQELQLGQNHRPNEGDVYQISPAMGNFGGCLLIVTEAHETFVQGYVTVPGQEGGLAYIRVPLDHAFYVGTATFVLNLAEMDVVPPSQPDDQSKDQESEDVGIDTDPDTPSTPGIAPEDGSDGGEQLQREPEAPA